MDNQFNWVFIHIAHSYCALWTKIQREISHDLAKRLLTTVVYPLHGKNADHTEKKVIISAAFVTNNNCCKCSR